MKTMHLDKITTLITLELNKPLPGKDAQFRMAPSSRRLAEIPEPEKRAGVMLLLFPSGNEICISFIKRTEYDGVHSGQVSFPGGMFEETDRSLEATARRETGEETGIDPAKIHILGTLTVLPVPISNFMVYPFVGYLDEEPVFIPDAAEVSFMILASLRVLLDPATIKKEKWNLTNESVMVPFYDVQSHRIWGATAMILSEFLTVISRAGLDRYFR